MFYYCCIGLTFSMNKPAQMGALLVQWNFADRSNEILKSGFEHLETLDSRFQMPNYVLVIVLTAVYLQNLTFQNIPCTNLS